MSSPKHIHWEKSSFSGQGNNCVELGSSGGDGVVFVRESDEPWAVLCSSPERVEGLLRAVRDGRLEL
ncbi:DUF397 domain-containing protein [Streptomyces sp. P38-E01]|uniref:DUF397 domain-containing protein n=1 Tax=Streptomyces tardus TaxID=2780544 RepID=A0A949JB97_9ACTN|nr:DUF397 domain-containing protein [Streptomyces tardus]MBU7596606.1 DUF397 domain-containing protein [Streptomyces tardus]